MQNLIKNVRSAVFRILCTYIHFCGDSAGRRIVPFLQCIKLKMPSLYIGGGRHIPHKILWTPLAGACGLIAHDPVIFLNVNVKDQILKLYLQPFKRIYFSWYEGLTVKYCHKPRKPFVGYISFGQPQQSCTEVLVITEVWSTLICQKHGIIITPIHIYIYWCLCFYAMARRVDDCAFLSFCSTVGISANPCRIYRSWYWKPLGFSWTGGFPK